MFDALKQKLLDAIVLIVFDPATRSEVWCDAINFAVGAVLIQLNPPDSPQQPVEYLSKCFNSVEYNYATTERELSGLMQALRTWCQYLLGRPITIGTDHTSLQWLTSQPHLSYRQVCWLEFISEFDVSTMHVPKKANIVTNALLHDADLDPARVVTVSASVESDLLAALRLSQEQDFSNTSSDLKRHALVNDRGMYMHDILVCRISCTGGQTIVVPVDKALMQRILALYHDSRLGGHLEPYRMIGSPSTRYYWPQMATDIRNYCKQYQTCKACKGITHAPQGQLQPLPIPEYFWQHITMDLITCLPKTDHGIDAIAAFVYHLSKYIQ